MKKKIWIFCSLFLILFGCMAVAQAEFDETTTTETCILEKIDGSKLIMLCGGETPREFIIGEDIKITDLAGRPLMLWQIKLPADVEVTHKCLTQDMCAYVVELVLQKRFIPQPQ